MRVYDHLDPHFAPRRSHRLAERWSAATGIQEGQYGRRSRFINGRFEELDMPHHYIALEYASPLHLPYYNNIRTREAIHNKILRQIEYSQAVSMFPLPVVEIVARYTFPTTMAYIPKLEDGSMSNQQYLIASPEGSAEAFTVRRCTDDYDCEGVNNIDIDSDATKDQTWSWHA